MTRGTIDNGHGHDASTLQALQRAPPPDPYIHILLRPPLNSEISIDNSLETHMVCRFSPPILLKERRREGVNRGTNLPREVTPPPSPVRPPAPRIRGGGDRDVAHTALSTTFQGVAEATIGLQELQNALGKEIRFGHKKRPKRLRGEKVETTGVEDWDPLETASRTAGKYFVVQSSKKEEA
ncbi:hypothetical protein CSIM01_11879 [Colletotrichum simmondsii]|uniref:Uncharacterized protein n=1 Tax=Colletotrichum simmondsii TaxID=703756 RepID=A0A135TB36_9PEZI|nr:hypothetical protein CSIM01_11879 [Colletotrichum simmondsii]